MNRQLHGDLLSPTPCQRQETAVPSTQTTLKHKLQFRVSHNGHIRRCSSCLICTLPTADDDVGGRRRLVIVGYCWSGHTSVDKQLDSPHAAASLVYSTPSPLPHSTAVQGLKKVSKMQLHRAAARAFGYNVHDKSFHADHRRRITLLCFTWPAAFLSRTHTRGHVTHDVT